MVAITLPDGTVRRFDGAVTGADIAAAIGPGLAKAALAIKVDGKLKDLSRLIDRDSRIEIVTRTHPDALELLRHDCAHVLAEAVQELYPPTQITFGPATENGFYYDFVRDERFSTEDLAEVQAKMREIVDRDETITREVWSRDDAVRWFREHNEKYKAEWVGEIPDGEEISIYRQGNWLDMCTGPHLPSTGKLGKAFKLMKISGAYWRGDAKNAQLQRIYGTCWPDEKQLAAYLHQLEEAEKRDHRRIGKEMNLFHQQEEAAGQVFWHPKGWTLWLTLEKFIRDRLAAAGYLEVHTPQLIDKSLFKASGHWDIYGDNMFKIVLDKGEREFGVKPMNCPGHVQIFRQGLKSYRDLPIRFAEFGSCHRNEPSGALHGIMRVRAFTQDDGHIFCTDDQITPESVRYCDLQMRVFRDLGFDNVIVKLALRPTPRAGTDEVWDRAEEGLRVALREAGLPFEELPGEGAFYGPKVEFHLTDAIGRTWQCGTLQLDFVLPERLDATYIGEDGQRHRPVMLHRALLGSMERFVGVLIEHYAGKLPLWLTPVQAVVATITSDADSYAEEVNAALAKAGLRAELDLRNEKINYKVREHSLAKVPIMLVVGKKEAADRAVALRRLGGEKQEVLALDEAITKLVGEAAVPAA